MTPTGVSARRDRPRVALVAAGPDIVGGHSVQAAALERGLRQDGFDVVAVPINPVFPAGWRRLRRVPGVRTVVNEALYARELRALRAVDVAHVFSASYWSFLLAPVPAMAAARAYGKRVILHYHSGEVRDHLDRWGWRVHPWLPLADEIVVCSEFQRQAFERHGHHARVIPNVVDAGTFAFRARQPLAPRILSNRNLEPYYAVEVVIEAFALIRAQRPDATLTIAGSGAEEARLRARAARAGMEGISFVGRVAPSDMPELLDRHDVLVNASVVDNQPVSIIEAFAAGLVVVSTPTGDIAEMLEGGRSGVLVPPRDPGAIAAAVLSLLARPDEAARLARRARACAGRYAWTAVREHWNDVYHGGGGAAATAPAVRALEHHSQGRSA